MDTCNDKEAQVSTNTSLYDYYKDRFEVIPANTPELQESCYRLRYHVYCLENPFEPRNPSEIETDSYDDQALHFLLRHKPSGLYVGTTRVIRCQSNGEKGNTVLPPVLHLCHQHGIEVPKDYASETAFEVSRFAVSKTFRRRVDDTQQPMAYSAEELEQDKKRIIPCMSLGLIGALYQMAVHEKLAHCCVIMAPTLARLLIKLGIVFQPIGPTIQYHGERQVYTTDINLMYDSILKMRPEILPILTDGGRYCFGAPA